MNPRVGAHLSSQYCPLIGSTHGNHMYEPPSLLLGMVQVAARLWAVGEQNCPPLPPTQPSCTWSFKKHILTEFWPNASCPRLLCLPFISHCQCEFGTLRLSFCCVTTIAPSVAPTIQLWPILILRDDE